MIGYWSDGEGDEQSYIPGCPLPADVAGTWDQNDRKAVLEYLSSGIPYRVYMGHSQCLLCDEPNGSTEFTDGEWAWPEGLAHYVSEHEARLPEAFVNKARSVREVPSELGEEIGEPQVYLEGGRGIAIPANADLQPNAELKYGRWLDWAAARTPAQPMSDAISLQEARSIAGELSHDTWQVTIEPMHGRWQVCLEPDGDRIYLQHCSSEVLTRCLGAHRPSDPEAILTIEQADRISAEFDGDWGAVRILAVAPGAWFVWVKPALADWPTPDEIGKQTGGGLELGWKRSHPEGSQSFAVREMDEFCWRQTLTRVRSDLNPG
jgi:hypothetical protein